MKKLSVICLIIVFGLVFTMEAYPGGLNFNYKNDEESGLSLFTGDTSLFDHYGDYNGFLTRGYLSTRHNMSNRMQSEEKPSLSSGRVIGEIFLGILGNIGLAFVGVQIGQGIDSGDDDDFEGILAAVLGCFAGSTLGSALGVYIAGNSGNVRGSFGKALLGSFWGEVVAAAVTLSTKSEVVVVVSFITLPPICAAILFNRSLRYRSSSENGTALLNFNKGKFRLGIPYVNIQPLPRYTNDAIKPVKVDINLMSVVF